MPGLYYDVISYPRFSQCIMYCVKKKYLLKLSPKMNQISIASNSVGLYTDQLPITFFPTYIILTNHSIYIVL